MFKKLSAIVMVALLSAALTACSGSSDSSASSQSASKTSTTAASNTSVETTTFTERDLEQTADTSEAESLALSDGNDITITKAGVYVISGTASDASIIVEAADDDKVQLVLDGANITNTDEPCVYVKNADKVFVTTKESSENDLKVTGTFTADGETNTDAVIFAKDDIVFNGEGTLTITSTDNGISGKDDVKITGGTISIDSASDAIEANDEISAAGGTVTINSQKDGLHAENDEDDTQGSIYISGGAFNINAASDGIQGTTTVVIDGGTFNITGSEGIEATN
ncbi:MAG: carbohydrate-binding domain-containing protein, partial [Ruminococcus sp.]|nr:carbohydrate-binding domain-containing protein [Ruminococcus sp.]